MSKITRETQRKNASEIFYLHKTEGSDLKYLNGEDTLFKALIEEPGTHQVKFVYRMGLGTVRIGQTFPITYKLLTINVEGGPANVPSQILVLDAAVSNNVLVKKLTL